MPETLRIWVSSAGEMGKFFSRILCAVYTLRVLRFAGEVLRQCGLLILGSTLVIWTLVFFVGLTCGIEGAYLTKAQGASAYAGAFTALCDLREIVPLGFGYMMSAKVGTGIVAELGAMRISDEIDALEVMAVRSVAYLVSTRVIAGVVVVIPLYCVAMVCAFLAARFGTTGFYHQSTGVYDHYFNTFLNSTDLLWSLFTVVLMGIAVMLVHTYYGYTATGGPAGVGAAVGRSVRTSLIVLVLLLLAIALSVYGQSGNFHLSG